MNDRHRPAPKSLALAAMAAAALFGARAAEAGPDPVGSAFGSRASAAPGFEAPVAVGDFDGDGRPDRVYLVRISPASAGRGFAPGVRLISRALGREPIGARGQRLALGIVQGDGRGRFLITGDMGRRSAGGFFDSPIWAVSPPPLHVVRRGSRNFAAFRRRQPSIRHDLLAVGTEAGIDMALYWTGRSYAVFTPHEEP